MTCLLRHILSTSLLSCGMSMVVVPFAVGQTTVPSGEDTSRIDRMMDEIVVTARKREESLQSTPISISAFTGEGLEFRGVTNTTEIAAFTPNLVFQNNPSFGGASNSAAIYIRGVGQKEFLPTTEPGVGVYVDGVYIARSVGAIMDLVDVERIEVLRGPQGTLFGRNTIGGAISITSQKPDDKIAGKATVTYGTDERMDFKASANVPLSDNFYTKLSVGSFKQDGYLQRGDSLDLGDRDVLTGRAAFRLLVGDTFEANLSLEGTRNREHGPAMQLIGLNLGNPIGPNTPPFATIHNLMANLAAGGAAMPCATPAAPLNLAVPGCYDTRYIRNDGFTDGTALSYSKSDLWGANLSLDWQVADNLKLRSITGYRKLDGEFARDGDHSPFTIAHYEDLLDHKQFTQEFQVLGDAWADRLQWMIGLYYFREKGNNVNTLDFTVSNFRSGGKFDNESYAAFAQGTFKFTDAFSVTLGGRYTDEKKKFLPDQIIYQNYFAGSGDPMLDAPFMQAGQRILPFVEKEISIGEFTPYLNLSWQINDLAMVYASYSEGFKTGGFSQRVFPPIVAGFTAPAGTPDLDLIPTFEPEFAKVYELGFKLNMFDQRLRLNGAVFHTEYDNMQVQVFTSVAPVTRNAASAKLTGFELELQASPVDNLFLEGGIGYIDARYSDIDFATTLVNKDNDFERVPEWTLSAGVSYVFTLGNAGSITPRVDWAYQSKMYNDAFNTPEIAQTGYHIVNANLGWMNDTESLGVTLGVKNLTDKKYLITGVALDAGQSMEGIYARGREWYLTVKASF